VPAWKFAKNLKADRGGEVEKCFKRVHTLPPQTSVTQQYCVQVKMEIELIFKMLFLYEQLEWWAESARIAFI
jgi:hypothetical protein